MTRPEPSGYAAYSYLTAGTDFPAFEDRKSTRLNSSHRR